MVSAERVMHYSSLEPEASLETCPPNEKPNPDWPQRGEIVFEDVSFRYSKDTPLVLKSLSCVIRPAEKVRDIMKCILNDMTHLYRLGSLEGLVLGNHR